MKRRHLIFLVYLAFVGLLSLSSFVLAKYVSEEKTNVDFTVGSILYFNYERSNLYRNEQSVQVVPSTYEEDGVTYQLLETMNVVPGDSLTYHFFVSNFNNTNGAMNYVQGQFFPNTKATLSLPIKGQIYNVDCTILYRPVELDKDGNVISSDGVWNNLVEGSYLNLPDATKEKVKYEFKLSVVVDDQVEDTTHDDYFSAVLSIVLFVNAASLE